SRTTRMTPDTATLVARRSPPASEQALTDDLLERLLREMGAAWARGERPLAEDFLARHPELRDRPDIAADLIYEEVCLRQQYGESVSHEAILRRFPQWRAELEVLLDCRDLFVDDAGPAFPPVGDMPC